MFRLKRQEYAALRSQIVTLERGRGRHHKYLPYAFREHGAIMAAKGCSGKAGLYMTA